MELKRGVFFSIDALIAVSIIFLILLIAIPVTKTPRASTEIHRDLIKSFSSLKIGEINNSYAQSLIANGTINDTEKTVLEQIGEFYVTNITLARKLADSILEEIDTTQNVGIWYEDKLISSKNSTPIDTAENVETARQVISGIKEGQAVTGFSARAFLISSLLKKYFYFGGYVGDGNLTAEINYTGSINSAEMEIAINNDFELLINSIHQGNYTRSPSETTPAKYSIPITNFQSGKNTIEFKGNNLHIAGGFIKITYSNGNIFEQSEIYKFPGMDGFINLYDGFYVPGNLTNLEIFLHANMSVETFLNIGNTTVFRNKTDGIETITINNTKLSSLLDYESISRKTIPLRFGIENATFITSKEGLDIFSVSATSGSTQQNVNDTDKMIDLIKKANKHMAEIILGTEKNRMGLVGYESKAKDEDYHNLTDNLTSLKIKADEWKAGGQRCICCGINKAALGFANESSDKKIKTMVVLSDGFASQTCPEQGTGDSSQDAIQASCDANQNYNVTIHAVGFGGTADEDTMQSIASCGNGSYYFSSLEGLVTIFNIIANDILNATFIEQTIESEDNITSKLFPDSYIKYDFEKNPLPYGIVLTIEKDFNNDLSGTLNIPPDSIIAETRVVSYSGAKWTDTVKINNVSVYKITDYGDNYIPIGDPYSINIPNSLVQLNNTIEVTVGSTPGNSSGGSSSNKIISTIAKNFSAYSSVSSNKEGCTWTIEFEDDTNITTSIPETYSGPNTCYFTSSQQQYDENDAIQSAVQELLETLDLNSNNKVDTKFTEEDLQIDVTELTGIPYTWSTEVQIRTWY